MKGFGIFMPSSCSPNTSGRLESLNCECSPASLAVSARIDLSSPSDPQEGTSVRWWMDVVHHPDLMTCSSGSWCLNGGLLFAMNMWFKPEGRGAEHSLKGLLCEVFSLPYKCGCEFSAVFTKHLFVCCCIDPSCFSKISQIKTRSEEMWLFTCSVR